MNILRPYAKYIAGSMGILGGALRMWTLALGEDQKALYPANHPGWLCYLGLTMAMIVFCFFISQKEAGSRHKNVLSFAVECIAAVGIGIYSLSLFPSTGFFALMVSALGMASTIALLYDLYRHTKSLPTTIFAYALPCLFFAVEMFYLNSQFGGEPELIRFIPQFLAVFSAAFATYQLWGNAVELDHWKRRQFWQLLAGYLCIAAAPGGHIMYACVGLWLLFAPCPSQSRQDLP